MITIIEENRILIITEDELDNSMKYSKNIDILKIEIDKIHNIIISELDTFLQNANHIYIYGAGKIAKIFFDYINKKKYTVEAFIVSNIQNEKSLFYCKQRLSYISRTST